MTIREKVVIGVMAGAGMAWGARRLLRLSRRITLRDRVVIITGASSGHGLMAARYAAGRGAILCWPRAIWKISASPRSK